VRKSLLPGSSLGESVTPMSLSPDEITDVSLLLEATETNHNMDQTGNTCAGLGSGATTVGTCIYFGNKSNELDCWSSDFTETVMTWFVIAFLVVMSLSALLFLLLGIGIAAMTAPRDEILDMRERARRLREIFSSTPGE